MTALMSTSDQAEGPKHLVVGVDYSELGERALFSAFDLALAQPTVIHIITVAAGDGPRLPEDLTHDAKQAFLEQSHATLDKYIDERLTGWARAGAVLDRDAIRTSVDFGDPAERILSLAQSVNADLVVVGTHGRRGIDHLLLGSVAETVLRNARCPVLVVRHKQHKRE